MRTQIPSIGGSGYVANAVALVLALCTTFVVHAGDTDGSKFTYRWEMVEVLDAKGAPGPSEVTIVHLYGLDSEKECKEAVLPYVQHLKAKTPERRIVVTPISYGVASWAVQGYRTIGTISCSVVPPDDIDSFFVKKH